MEAFTMEVAGLAVGVEPLFQSTIEYCRGYLVDRAPEFSVRLTQADLSFEQSLLEQEALEEELKIRKFKEPFLERSAIQRRVADHLLTRDTLMLHGSTVAVDGMAYLFTAPCGTGKSTHTRLWRELFGPRAVMVNDDKPFLQLSPSGVLAYGSPWSGKHGLASNVCAPLKGICLLRRGVENQICPATAENLASILYDQAHRPLDTALAEKARSLVDALMQQVPLWTMACNKDPEAARIAACAMKAVKDNLFFKGIRTDAL